MLSPLPEMPAFAVVLSDYASTAVALLDGGGGVLTERWVDSGTRAPGLVAALSGDVVLPSAQRGDGSLTLIDRFRTDVISRFCMPGGQLAGQGRTHRGSPTVAYSSNPHDLLWDDDGLAWASRFEPNDAAVEALDGGSDLYALDASTMEATGARIDLRALGAATTLGNLESPFRWAYPRPSRIVRLGDHAVVGLYRASEDFQAGADGMVALLELASRRVEGVPIPGLAGCSSVQPLSDRDNAVLVSCTGIPFGTRQTAGLVLLEIDETGGTRVAASWLAREHPTLPLAVYKPASLGGTQVVASGGFDLFQPDQLWLHDLETGSSELLHESTGPDHLGTPAWRPEEQFLLVPDEGLGLLRFREGTMGLELEATLPLGLDLGLPPRHVYQL